MCYSGQPHTDILEYFAFSSLFVLCLHFTVSLCMLAQQQVANFSLSLVSLTVTGKSGTLVAQCYTEPSKELARVFYMNYYVCVTLRTFNFFK